MKYLIILLCLCGNLHAQIWQLDSLFNWHDDSIVESVLGDTSRYNEVWGFVQNDREYAVIGSTIGSHFFDVTDPLNVMFVDFVQGAYQGQFAIHRDYHDYQGYMYIVCDEGPSTLQIADLSYLPDSVHLVYDSDTLIIRAHNIYIDTAKATLYGISVKTNFASPFNNVPIMALSLANPEKPSLIYNFLAPSPVHDAFVRNDTVYANSSYGGLYVFDFSNPPMIGYLGSLTTYAEQGYNHSGWLNEKGDIYAFADETHGTSIKICDVSDLNNISVLSLINSGVDSNSIPHNLMIKADFLYISYYHDGLYIYDISDPSIPVEIGHYDTYLHSDHDGYKGAWGVHCFLPSGNILISDIQAGLFIFSLTDLISSVDNISADDIGFSVIPNPNNGQFTINLSGNIDNAQGEITVFNALGKLVYTEIIDAYCYNANLTSRIFVGRHLFRTIPKCGPFRKSTNSIEVELNSTQRILLLMTSN